MAFNVQTFLTRLGSAAVFAALMLIGLLWNQLAFVGLFFIVNFLCLKEYIVLTEKIVQHSFSRNEKANFILVGIGVFLLIAILPFGKNYPVWLFQRAFYYLLGMVIGSTLLFFYFKRSSKSYYLLSGIGYVSIALGLLVQLRYTDYILPIALILMIWMNDTLAYLCGSFFGKRPFFPSISPKKTIEGTLGGILFTMALAWVWFHFYGSYSLLQWISIAAIASIIGTIGDLAESKLKRMAGVKDSGSIMPGHGGALDRFDSLILAAPVTFLYALICL
ncbi:MAG: phosphatidate cytidylyltransferase [Chitinophagaceae bacterium]|nr:phosphatidate cytidylyltransferase [Chitinophagaceae bacterium]